MDHISDAENIVRNILQNLPEEIAQCQVRILLARAWRKHTCLGMIDWVVQEGRLPENFVNVDLRCIFGMYGTRNPSSDVGCIPDLR